MIWFSALRPHHWLKNLLVFIPALAAHSTDPDAWLASVLACIAFCLVASAGYLFNDVADLQADRAHPFKALRPIAGGQMSSRSGIRLAIGLAVIGLVVAFLFVSIPLGLVTAGYLLVALFYTAALKRFVALDIVTLASLYTVRIIAGGVAAGIVPSTWLLAFSIFFFLALATVKRIVEVGAQATGSPEDQARRPYSVSDMPFLGAMAFSSGFLSVLVLALYIESPTTNEVYNAPQFLWGICLVLIYWISRIVLLAQRARIHHDPIVFAVSDPVSWICGALVMLFSLSALVLQPFS